MDKLTVKDLRRAIVYVAGGSKSSNFNAIGDEALLKMDFYRDLNMGNIRVINVIIELERIHGLRLQPELLKSMHDNTVSALMDTINNYLKENS